MMRKGSVNSKIILLVLTGVGKANNFFQITADNKTILYVNNGDFFLV